LQFFLSALQKIWPKGSIVNRPTKQWGILHMLKWGRRVSMRFIGKRDLAIICIGKRDLYHILWLLSGLRAEIRLKLSGTYHFNDNWPIFLTIAELRGTPYTPSYSYDAVSQMHLLTIPCYRANVIANTTRLESLQADLLLVHPDGRQFLPRLENMTSFRKWRSENGRIYKILAVRVKNTHTHWPPYTYRETCVWNILSFWFLIINLIVCTRNGSTTWKKMIRHFVFQSSEF
jgi:hypothetical protein